MELFLEHSQIVPAPFDTVAARYDETFTFSKIGRAQRAAVWRELAKTFHAGEHLLEIGCGTGVDACFLAERKIRVVACDPSSRMIQVLKERLKQADWRDFVQPCILGAEELESLQSSQLFDGAFSNFGAINCVADLRKLSINFSRLLKPGAWVLLCWMGPNCVWEQAWHLVHGLRDNAFRRLRNNGLSARIADGVFIHVRYPSVGCLRRAFAPEFRVKSIRGIGVAVPPSYMEGWALRHPRWLEICERADLGLAQCPAIRILGDHVLVRLQRN